MTKKTPYFSHDSNARNDEKILAVRMRFGAEGYGIYFMILERLRDEYDYMSIKDYNVLAFDFRVSADKVKSIIEDFGLFIKSEDGKKFYSNSFLERMEEKDLKSEKARESAFSRWNKNQDDANAMRTHSKGNAIKVKESKVKESKVGNKIPIPPGLNSENFIKNWEILISQKRWKKKSEDAIIKSLDKLSRYNVDYATILVENAISGDYQGVVFADTDEKYNKWKQNLDKNGNTGQNRKSETSIGAASQATGREGFGQL